MGLRDFFKRRREDSNTSGGDSPSNRRPELRDAWLAFETDCPDRSLELATPHLNASDNELSADAKKLIGLIHFRRNEYGKALQLFRDVVTVQDDAGNWFNIVTAATLSGDIEAGQRAFDRAVAAQESDKASDGLSVPFMRQYYACALRDQLQHDAALTQIEELRSIYEQLKITDDTFVYIRGVPFLSHTMDVAVDVFRGLGDSFDAAQWIDSFATKLDDEGREYLETIKRRLNSGT